MFSRDKAFDAGRLQLELGTPKVALESGDEPEA